jgi:hypothetical protein
VTPEDKRAQRLQLLEDHIGRALQDSLASGELRAAPSWGKPLDFGDGYEQTPPELRMPMKVLKDSGFVPPEVAVMHEIAALRQSLVDAPDDEATRARRQRLSELRQHLALRLEKLRLSGSM